MAMSMANFGEIRPALFFIGSWVKSQKLKQGEFLNFFRMYFIQHCFICQPSDSTVSEDAGIKPRTVATSSLAVRRSNHSARSHSQSARSHPTQKDLIHIRLNLIHTRLDLIHTRLDLIHTRLNLIHTGLDLIHTRLDLIHTRLNLIHTRLDLIHAWLHLIQKTWDGRIWERRGLSRISWESQARPPLWYKFLHFFWVRRYMTSGQCYEGNILLLALPSIFILCSWSGIASHAAQYKNTSDRGTKSYIYPDSPCVKILEQKRLKWSPVSLSPWLQKKRSPKPCWGEREGGRDGGGGDLSWVHSATGWGARKRKISVIKLCWRRSPTPLPFTPPPGEWNQGTEGVHIQPVWFLSLSFYLRCKGLEKKPAQINILKGEKLWGFLCKNLLGWWTRFWKKSGFGLNKCCI